MGEKPKNPGVREKSSYDLMPFFTSIHDSMFVGTGELPAQIPEEHKSFSGLTGFTDHDQYLRIRSRSLKLNIIDGCFVHSYIAKLSSFE